MSNSPSAPMLEFIGSPEPEIKTGEAKYTFWEWAKGDWRPQFFVLDNVTFTQANAIKHMLDQVWDGAKAVGYANCEAVVTRAMSQGAAP